MWHRLGALVCGAVGLVGLASCYRHTVYSDGDGDGDSDAELTPVQNLALPVPAPNGADILFVVDNSNSMIEEQDVLAEQIVVLLRELVSPSSASAPVVDDLHVGIVSTDLGSGWYQISTCEGPLGGDGGALRNEGMLAGCQASYGAVDCDHAGCPWLAHSPTYPDANPANDPIWEDFGCVATLGTLGCGFEQPLEASYQALVVQTQPGRPNEGFLRDDSALVVIYVTDEDDCSTGDEAMFDPERDELGSLNVRCAINPDAAYPISRYHDAFVELRRGNAARVAVAAITGVPVDGSWNPGDPLEVLRELRSIDPENSNQLVPSCDTEMGEAYPPVRIAELVYSFGRNGVLASICNSDWTPALEAITQAIQAILPSSCLLPNVPFDAGRCRVIETLANDAACPHLADSRGPGRTSGWLVDQGIDGWGRRLCEVLPADYDRDGCPDGASTCAGPEFPDGLQGWFYVAESGACELGEIRLTGVGVTDQAVELRLECPVDE